MSKDVLVLQGPNLNMVGKRDRGIYGKETAQSINEQIKSYAKKIGFTATVFQSNSEGTLIDKIHSSNDQFIGAVINAGALSHYSYALRDAITCVKFPFIEVHMSNVFARENFRHISVIAPACAGSISGFGKVSYFLALQALKELM